MQSLVHGAQQIQRRSTRWQDAALMYQAQSSAQIDTAIREAFDQHYEQLSTLEREQFQSHSCESVEDYLSLIRQAWQKQQDRSKLTTSLKPIRPLFETIRMYMPVAKGISQACPNPSAAILGGITCIVTIEQNIENLQNGILEDLATMSNAVYVLQEKLKQLYDDNRSIHVDLARVYGHLLDYVHCVHQHIYHKQGKERGSTKLFGSALAGKTRIGSAECEKFKAECQNLVQQLAVRLDQQSSNMAIASLDIQESTYEAVHQVYRNQKYSSASLERHYDGFTQVQQNVLLNSKAVQETTVKKTFLDGLPTTSYGKHYDDLLDLCAKNTGQTLFTQPSYNDWKQQDESAILWVTGGSGTGKSCLASLCIQDLKTGNRKVAYVFCKDLAGRRETDRIVATLLHNLLQQADTESEINKIYASLSGQSGATHSTRQLSSAVTDVLKALDKTYIVIDALDECEDESRIAKVLKEILGASSGVKILAFSRPGHEKLKTILEPISTVVDLTPEMSYDDIGTFIQDQMVSDAFSTIQDPSLKDLIREKVLDQSVGDFSYAASMLKNLADKRSDGHRRQALNELPPTKSASYGERIQKLIKNLTVPGDRERAFKSIWYTYYSWQPLTEQQMMQAIAINPGMTLLDLSFVEHPRGIDALCDNLIRIVDGTVEFCHKSFQDYLDDLEFDASDPFLQYASSDVVGHDPLGDVCTRFLLLENFSEGPVLTQEQFKARVELYPFLKYAARHWSRHLWRYDEGAQILVDVRHLLAEESRLGLIMQCALADLDEDEAFPFPGSMTALHLIALIGDANLAKLVRLTIDDFICQNELGLTPCDYAIRKSHHEVVHTFVIFCQLIEMPYDSVTQQTDLVISAARNSWTDILQSLMPLEGNVDRVDKDSGMSALIFAAKNGDFTMTELLLEAGADVAIKDSDGMTAFLWAIKCGGEEIWRLLLDRGADCHDVDNQNRNALHIAVENNEVPTIRELINRGVDSTTRATVHGDTLMHQAAMIGSPKIIELLHLKGLHIDGNNNDNWKPLDLAALFGNTEAAKTLIHFGASLYSKASFGTTPLHSAALTGHLSFLRELLAGEPSRLWVNEVDAKGFTPLHYAAIGGHLDCVEFILAHGARVDDVTNTPNKNTALNLVLSDSNVHVDAKVSIAKELLRQKADIHIANSLGVTPLHWITQYGITELLEDFQQAGANPNSPGDQPYITCLNMAVIYEHESFAITLCNLFPNLDINTPDEDGLTALHYAAHYNMHELANLLLRFIGLASQPDNEGSLPIHLAACMGSVEVMTVLMDVSDTSSSGELGYNTLTLAARGGHLACVKTLIQKGKMDSAGKDFAGRTPMTEAARNNHVGVCDYLISLSIPVSTAGRDGMTALHFAIKNGNQGLVERLLAAGASLAAVDETGITPLSEALLRGDEQLYGVLKQRMDEENLAAAFQFISKSERTTLHYAAIGGSRILLQEALRYVPGALEHRDVYGATPVVCAAWYEREITFLELVDRGANLQVISRENKTPVWYVAGAGMIRCLEICIQRVDCHLLNLQSAVDGSTPLVHAIRMQQSFCAHLLLKHGADPSIPDLFGENALCHAARMNLHFPGFKHIVIRELATREELIAITIRLLDQLMNSDYDVPIQKYDRICNLYNITTAFHKIGQTKCNEHLIACYAELLHYSTSFRDRRLEYTCNICHRYYFDGDFFRCISDTDSHLCAKCHDVLQTNDFEKPKDIAQLEKFESSLRPVIIAVNQYHIFDICKVVASTAFILEAVRWVHKFRLRLKRFQTDQKNPKWSHIIDERCRRLHEGVTLFNDILCLKDDTFEGLSLRSRNIEELLVMQKRYSDWLENIDCSWDVRIFKCTQHRFFHSSDVERSSALKDQTLFNDQGRMTRKALENILAYSEDLLLEESGAGSAPASATAMPIDPPTLSLGSDITSFDSGRPLAQNQSNSHDSYSKTSGKGSATDNTERMIDTDPVEDTVSQRPEAGSEAPKSTTISRLIPEISALKVPASLLDTDISVIEKHKTAFQYGDHERGAEIVEIQLPSSMYSDDIEVNEFRESLVIFEGEVERRRPGRTFRVPYAREHPTDKWLAIGIHIADAMMPGYAQKHADQVNKERRIRLEQELAADAAIPEDANASDLQVSSITLGYSLLFGI